MLLVDISKLRVFEASVTGIQGGRSLYQDVETPVCPQTLSFIGSVVLMQGDSLTKIRIESQTHAKG